MEWAQPILDVVFDGVSDAVDYQLRHVLDEDRYWRLQVELQPTPATTSTTPASDNLASCAATPRQLIAERSADIDAAIAALT